MNVHPFIPKQHPDLPDSIGVERHYLDGTREQIEAASHMPGDKLYEVHTKNDEIYYIPWTSIKKIKFDRRFSKLIEIRLREKSGNSD